ncbi:uncharacterized protein LOC121766771 [Salvia splendens]|nr:uncharacterized protein LOC121766771 [Salvia splendens]
MKDGTLMPVLICKIHCPFICFCKPSAAHLYTSAPLKLEGSPHVVHSAFAVDKSPSVVEEGSVNGNKNSETVLKSCIREPQGKEAGKKRVEWKDNTGKQLAEIKEFESRGLFVSGEECFFGLMLNYCLSETGDTLNEEDGSRCHCAIL